jgi:hypothetical protein
LETIWNCGYIWIWYFFKKWSVWEAWTKETGLNKNVSTVIPDMADEAEVVENAAVASKTSFVEGELPKDKATMVTYLEKTCKTQNEWELRHYRTHLKHLWFYTTFPPACGTEGIIKVDLINFTFDYVLDLLHNQIMEMLTQI